MLSLRNNDGKPASSLYTDEVLDQYTEVTATRLDEIAAKINNMFNWAESPQGEAYWNNISNELNLMSSKIRSRLDAKGMTEKTKGKVTPVVNVELNHLGDRVLDHIARARVAMAADEFNFAWPNRNPMV